MVNAIQITNINFNGSDRGIIEGDVLVMSNQVHIWLSRNMPNCELIKHIRIALGEIGYDNIAAYQSFDNLIGDYSRL
ncbi:MAG: hypothetical protein CMN73_09415 [Sphingomonas sp.]|nr:hypothetical protein [Sphingomonas sp.]